MTIARPMIEFIASQDLRVMSVVHRWRAPRWIRLWMVCATRGGDGWIWYAQGLVVLALGGASRYHAVAAAGVAAGAGITVFLTLKRAIGRKRPSVLEPHCWATLLPPDQFSFPSGHSITAFAVTVPLMLFYPPWTIGLLFCALSIAISRIILGLHFLSDVVAGCLIGASLGYVAFFLFS